MKRLIDVVSSVILLVVLSPVLVVVALAILIDSGRPVVFTQRRIGLHRKEFIIYKFRTMRQGTPDLAKSSLSDLNNRVTPLGRLLRRTSLDELPQLVNILRGDMSLVGPRPALYNQYDLIDLREAGNVHTVRPGVTGLAQISGREELDIQEKVRLDREYVRNQSLLLDVKILWRTVATLLYGRGAF